MPKKNNCNVSQLIYCITNRLNKLSNYLLILALVAGSVLHAMPTDNNQPMVISSLNFELNYIAGYAAYSGEVKLNQGTRNLEADQLYVYFEPDTNLAAHSDKAQKKIKEIRAVSEHSLVHYSEKMQKEANLMHARAKTIKLMPKQNLLTLEHQAVIEQNNRQLTSDLLHYNIKTEVAYSPVIENKRTKLTLG